MTNTYNKMNKKIYKPLIFIILSVIFLSLFLFFKPVLSFTTSYFNNSLGGENLTFTSNQNITRYLDIYRYANVTLASINITSHGLDNLNLSLVVGNIQSWNLSGTYPKVNNLTTSITMTIDSGENTTSTTFFSDGDHTTALNVTAQTFQMRFNEINFSISPSLNYTYRNLTLNINISLIASSGEMYSTGAGTCDDGDDVSMCFYNWSSNTYEGLGNFQFFLLTSGEHGFAFFEIPSDAINNQGILKFKSNVLYTPNVQTNVSFKEIYLTYNGAILNKTDITSSIGNVLLNGNCSNGITNGNNCSIPLIFHSDTSGILEYSDIQINWASIPNVTLDSPTNNSFSSALQTFQCGAIDGVGLSNMTLNIWNSTGSLNVSSLNQISSLSNSTQFNVTFSKADTYFWNCLARNIENNISFSNKNFTHTVDLNNPIINLNSPTNNRYLNNNTDVNFIYTPSHQNGLDTCRLYANFNNSFSINQTDNTISNYSTNLFTQNLTERNGYVWTVWCNTTTSGNPTFSQNGNFTLNIDLTKPNITIGDITTPGGSQTITFNNTIQDLNLNTCKYTIHNSLGNIDGLNNNVSFTCNSNTQATVTTFGTYNLTIYGKDLANNENSSTKEFITSTSSTSGGGGGGGGGGSTTTKEIPVIALQDINSSEVYSDLTKAILYSTINNYCSNKINKEPLAIVDYSQQCQLTTNDLLPIINNLKEFAVDISEEDLRKFLENYKQSKFLQTYATEENIKEYGLFTSVLGETTIWLLTPPSIDSYFTIFNREGTVETLPRVISSNKILKSCEVVSNTPSLICEVTSNYTAKLSYEITDTSFFTKTFSGTILLTTDAEPERTEQRRSQITFRVINFGSNTAIYTGVGTLGIVSLLIFIIVKRRRVKFTKQVRELISLK